MLYEVITNAPQEVSNSGFITALQNEQITTVQYTPINDANAGAYQINFVLNDTDSTNGITYLGNETEFNEMS